MYDANCVWHQKDPLKNKPRVIIPGFVVNGLWLNYF